MAWFFLSVVAFWSIPVADAQRLTKVGDLPNISHNVVNQSKMQFTSELNGVIENGGRYWKTADGGRNWSAIRTDAPSFGNTEGFHFFRSGFGIISVNSSFFVAQSYGEHLEPLDLPIRYPEGTIVAVSFLSDRRTGWAAGARYVLNRAVEDPTVLRIPHWAMDVRDGGTFVAEPAIYSTENGGATWRRQLLPLHIGFMVETLHFSDAMNGVALIEGSVAMTADGGNSWRVALNRQKRRDGSDPAPRAVSVFELDPAHLWVGYDDGALMRTSDGGREWVNVLTSTGLPTNESRPHESRYPQNIYFFSPKVGICSDNTSNGLFASNDGGRSWSNLLPSQQSVVFSALDASHIWLLLPDGIYTTKLVRK